MTMNGRRNAIVRNLRFLLSLAGGEGRSKSNFRECFPSLPQGVQRSFNRNKSNVLDIQKGSPFSRTDPDSLANEVPTAESSPATISSYSNSVLSRPSFFHRVASMSLPYVGTKLGGSSPESFETICEKFGTFASSATYFQFQARAKFSSRSLPGVIEEEEKSQGKHHQVEAGLSRDGDGHNVSTREPRPYTTEPLPGDETVKDGMPHGSEAYTQRNGWSEFGWTREEVLNWPNVISGARMLSGPFIAWMITADLLGPALIAVVLAGLSDWLDGYVARRMEINTVLGSYLDPIADKVLVGCVAVSMASTGLLHPALVGLIVARDSLLLGGAFVFRAYSLRWQWTSWQQYFKISVGGAGKVKPLFISKLGLVGMALVEPGFGIEVTYSVVPILSWAVAVTTILSTVGYGLVYLRNPMGQMGLKDVAHVKHSFHKPIASPQKRPKL